MQKRYGAGLVIEKISIDDGGFSKVFHPDRAESEFLFQELILWVTGENRSDLA